MNLSGLDPFRRPHGEAFMLCPGRNPVSRIRPLLNVAAAFLTGVVATAMLAVFVGAMG